MIRKLQIKFVVINMTMVTIMLCVIFGLVYYFTQSHLEDESISMMRSIAADPFQLGRPDEQSPEPRLPYFTLQLGLRGEIVSTGGGYYDLSDQALLRRLIDASVGTRRETGIVEGLDLRFCRVATHAGTVLVFADISSENNTLENLMRTSLLIGAFSFFVFLGISICLARWAVKPVATAWQQQKQFVADASHELKTPLTVIMTNAELLQSDQHTPEERQSFSRSIYIMSQQMRALIENLLELARSDAGTTQQQMAAVDLSRLVVDMALTFEGVFVEKGLTLESSVEPGITVRGSEQALRQVADILLDNAGKYSLPGGTTTIRLCSTGQGRCQLRVADPGPEIPPEELRNIFRRFYRLDKARSRDGSFGLGLSIAESIVAQHRGRIWAESRDGINTFVVELKKDCQKSGLPLF